MDGPQGVSAAGEAHRRAGEDGRVAAAEALPGKEYDGMGLSLFAPQISLFFLQVLMRPCSSFPHFSGLQAFTFTGEEL